MHSLELIGNTPLLEAINFDTGPCRLFLKLESANPGGSIKDRIAVAMINDAERTGALKPGGTIVEATAGNTGLGLALVAGQRGYRVVLVVPDKMSREKITQLQAMGAQVVLTRSDVGKGHPDYYQDRAEAIAREFPNSWYVNQFSNPANPAAHETSTGPELWEQTGGKIDAVVVGVGSGGTLGGLTRYFQRVAPQIEIVIADPAGSVIAPYVTTGLMREAGSWLVEGIGEDFIPKNADFSMVKAAYSISDKDSFLAARSLLRTNGILAGSSSGTLLAAALQYCQAQTKAKNVITFVCDGGARYLSKMFSDLWMVDQGFLPRESYGDLRDLISHHYKSGAIISVSPTDRLRSAYIRMKMYDISQLPVLDKGRIVGIIDESDLLLAVHAGGASLDRPAKDFMSAKLKTVRPTESIDKVIALLRNGLTAIVSDENGFHGIITKMDAVDYLRRVG